MDKYLKVQDVASLLAVSDQTVRRQIQAGNIIAKRVGNQFRISERELNAYCSREDEPEAKEQRRTRKRIPRSRTCLRI